MMASAHFYAELIEEYSGVVVVCVAEQEADYSGFARGLCR